ncbi:hypothetical protein [Actinomadura opuntiae]|uniref:hypothetical protein n=1 Tax=Actinomadura sp. OS1-43 TaxID=604315 RepID=UPI00255AE4E2|nr:hypothetical protein [Actinomadura sp. OS1-43]MDL4815261.1 hypothetical protein [Actinomadura sp. OS1-43]
MTAPAENDVDAAARPGLRTGRWRLPAGRAAAGQVRRVVHDALRTWGLGPAAGELSDHLTALVQDLLTRAAARGPVDLRLELRASARLLLGEIRDAAPAPSGAADRPSGHADGHGIFALTYGRRPSRKRVRYIHSFAWWQQDPVTDR